MAIEKYEYIKAFKPTEDKIDKIIDYLINKPLYLPDEFRDKQRATQLMFYHLFASPAMFFELGKFQGLLGFTEIIPNYKSDVFFKLWDKRLWGPSFARELRSFVNSFMLHLGLRRLSLSTPDERGAELAKMACDFKVEGRQACGFRWNGRLLTNIMLRKIRQEG